MPAQPDPTLGPYLARHDVRKVLGGALWDEDTKTWIVLKTSSNELHGFCAVNQSANRSRSTMRESLCCASESPAVRASSSAARIQPRLRQPGP
ncbi:hypothetical protein [Streptomyces mutabilis]|uniref:Uncharacterized protein n=1 Tax=Streptomyces mutabilis TaxID=67332 RepID=A0A086MR57_9ACTN|nr:hypothetical protein [Streptomyces mutabilis]KFG71375.1 hypothetical protein FM21_34325 [Streptomyces mutabilis]